MKTCLVDSCPKPSWHRGYCSAHYTRLLRYGSPLGFKPRPTAEQRFWAKVVKRPYGCWEWTGAQDGHGYGHFNAGGGRGKCKYVKAYRWAYEHTVGPIPMGMHADHMCHNKICVNPAHIRIVQPRSNFQNRAGAPKNNTSGYWGVSLHKASGRYRAYVNIDRKQIHLGLFDTAEEAGKVAADARGEMFDIPARTRKRRAA